MRALFKGAKLEVESVIREVSEAVLYDASIGKETQRLRAQALGIVGEIYMAVKKDDDKPAEVEDYVKVDTQASKQREKAQSQSSPPQNPW